jgi:hypothetical protein
MSDFSDWLQNNLVDWARLAVQCAILAAVVSYGRKLLKTLRASQEQVGALLRLSVSDAAAHAANETIAQPEPSLEAETFSSLLHDPLHAPSAESPRSSDTEREHSLGGRVLREPAGASAVALEEPPSFTPWVSAPGMEQQHAEARAPQLMAPSANRVASWLQAPMRRPGVSPWRKVVRWLQAPAGN